jgi:hypothetical protein
VTVDISLQQIARALNGKIRNDQVLAPGPGHSATDRSLSVKLSDSGDDFVVHSFAGDDAIECKKYVRERCGLPSFKPNGNPHSDQDMTRLIQEAIASQHKKPRSKPVTTYNYEDRDGTLLYQVLRYENPKKSSAIASRTVMGAGLIKVHKRALSTVGASYWNFQAQRCLSAKAKRTPIMFTILVFARQRWRLANGRMIAFRRSLVAIAGYWKTTTTLAARRH